MTPRPAKFSHDDAVDAAYGIVVSQGVEALTMRRLSGALGVDPMAPYRLFSTRAALVAAVANRFWERLRLPETPADDWHAAARTIMRAIRSELAAQPAVIPLVSTHPISSTAALVIADAAIGRLLRAGAPAVPALGDLVNTMAIATIASALGEYAPPAGSAPGDDAQARDPRTAAGDEADAAEALPHLGALAAAGWRPEPEAQFEMTISALLAGWHWPADGVTEAESEPDA